MRISDWSSDVCSSDLARRRCRADRASGAAISSWPDRVRDFHSCPCGAAPGGRDAARLERARRRAVAAFIRKTAMAPLVLTVVGGIVGGPVGAAIGAGVGREVGAQLRSEGRRGGKGGVKTVRTR